MDQSVGTAVIDPALADPRLADVNRKLDLLAEQVQFLAEQAQVAAALAERQRQERAELMRDLMPIVNDAFRMSVEQLEEVEEYVDLADLLRLVKRLLRNGRNFERMLDQLESLMDLAGTVGPLTDEAFGKAVDVLQEADNKGYFRLAQEGMQIADNVVTSFSVEDVRRLGDNVVLILNTVKDMTQPEILGVVRGLVAEAQVEVTKPVNTSLPSLVRQMRDPDVRRGLSLAMRLAKLVGARANGK